MNRVAFRSLVGTLGTGIALTCGCGGDEPKKQLSDGCVQNSDCAGSLICAFGHCHEPCDTSKDCPSGARCIQADDGTSACQLREEDSCKYNSDCPEPLTCASDDECRNECKTDRDCVSGQTCATAKVCAEKSEVDEDDNLTGAGGTSSTGAGETAGGAGGEGGSAGSGTSDASGGRRATHGSAGQGEAGLGSQGVSGAGTEAGADGTGNADGGGAGPTGGADGVPLAGGAGGGGASGEPAGSAGMVAQAGAGAVSALGGAPGGSAAGAGGAATTCIPARTVGGATSIIYGFDSATGPNQVSDLTMADPTGNNDKELATTAALEAGTGPIVSFDPDVGDPTSGSLRIEIPFNAYGQDVDYQFVFDSYVDFSGRTLSLKVMVDPGGFMTTDDTPGGIIFYAKTGANWDWGAAPWKNLLLSDYGQWLDVEFNLDCPDAGTKSDYNPKYTKSIGFKICTGGPVTASLPPLPSTAVIHIDTIGYRDNE
jgi:hypothetical protein